MFSRDLTLQALSALEEHATVLSVPLLTPCDLAAARAINAQMAQCTARGTVRRYGQLGHELHELLYSRCPNGRLLELVRVQAAQLRAAAEVHPVFSAAAARQAVAEHEALLDLIEARAISPAGIASRLRTHRRRTMRVVLDDMLARLGE